MFHGLIFNTVDAWQCCCFFALLQ